MKTLQNWPLLVATLALVVALAPAASTQFEHLKTDLSRVGGTAIGATNPVPTRAANSAGYIADDVAEGAASSGNPIPVGGLVETSVSAMTLLADGNRSTLGTFADRATFVRQTPLEDLLVGNTSNTDGSSHEVIAAQGAGIKSYLTSVTCSNTSTTGIYVELKSGTTVRWRVPVPAAAASDVNGYTFNFQDPLPPNAANEAWNADGSAAVTTLFCSFKGFKSKI